MTSHVAVLVSLALAILFSPETVVVGLIIAGDKKVPRLAALAFAIGGIAGIAFATTIGLWIAHAGRDAAAVDHHGSWPGFIVRVVIAGALLAIGTYRAVNAVRKTPIPDVSQPGYQPSKPRAWLTRRFPTLMGWFDPGADLSVRGRVIRAVLAGFAMCGLHPKIFPIAIAAGHQIMQITHPAERSLGVLVFAAIAVVPALVPVVIDVVRPGSAGRIKDGYERIMKVHGRWITAVLLLGVGLFVAFNAWHVLPNR